MLTGLLVYGLRVFFRERLRGISLPGPASAAPPGDDSGYGAVLCREAAGALPGLRSYDLSLIYSPLLLKLPVLTASKSLRRSRKAGAARMDAG